MTSPTDLGPLDWRIAITDKSGRPTPEFQRRWNTQRNNNSLISSISTGAGPPTGTPKDGAEYVDTSTTPYTLYLGEGGTWHQVGAMHFTDLLDAPHNYTSASLKLVRVNTGATGLEFVTLSTPTSTTLTIAGTLPGAVTINLPNSGVTAGSYTAANITVDAQGRVTAAANGSFAFTNLTDVPHSYSGSALKLLRVNSGATGLEFFSLGSSDIPFLLIGFALGTGAPGTNVATPALAPRAGSVTKCKFVTKASDPSTDLTFTIKKNGTSIFSSSPTVTHGTSSSTVSTFTSLTSSPLSIAVDDVFTLDISSGTSTWQGTIQLE